MLIDDLDALGAPPVLLEAARLGLVTALECAMPECVCPEGRGHFDGRGRSNPWALTPDRWPIAGRDGGPYAPDNVRLAHARCNYADGSRVALARRHARGDFDSPKVRAQSRRNMATMHERWRGTPEWDEWHQMAGRARAATLTSEHQALAARSGNPRKAICQRWDINRGKPCTCGHHTTAAC